MKILFFYQYFGTPSGSWSTRVYELTRRWVNAGHSVTVVTAPYDKSDIRTQSFISKQEIEGINLIVIDSGDSNRLSKISRMFRAIRFSLVSVWYSLTLSYDVCIASSGPITIGLPMIISKRIRRKKTVFEVRDLWPAGGIELGLIQGEFQKKAALWFEKLCYKSADLVVTASIGQKDHIRDRYPDLKMEVVPNASDLQLFGKESSQELPSEFQSKVLFTHIGSLGLIHNIDYWMKVAIELKFLDLEEKIIIVFIGDGVDREKLITEKSRLGLNNIYFLGLKPKSELPVWVQNSRATLFATLSNPVQDTSSPNKIFDSFAAGIPIIQTTKGWIQDLVKNRKCGINVSLDSPKETAKVMKLLSEEDGVAKELGENARILANDEFNRDLLADKYLKYIQTL